MTPPAAAAAPRTRTTKRTAPPRRVSGPARGRQRTVRAGGGAAAVAAAPPLALRLGGAVHGIAEHHLLERIIRGRAWIGILAVGLIGIVFMQVSMLRMNAGIGQAVERSSVLERQNAGLRATISELSSGDRIAAEAARMGLILPAGTPRFLDARGADARRALASMTRPGEGIVAAPTDASPEAAAATTSTTPTLGQSSVAPTNAAATATPETGTAPVASAPPAGEPGTVAAQPAASATPAAPPPTTSQQPTSTHTAAPATSAPPPTTASTGGMDASGQVG